MAFFFIAMGSKILYWLGVIACVVLIVSCFMEWAYFDIGAEKVEFTGFYSYQNYYGKPGKFLVGAGTIALLLMLLPKLWAKRVNLFVCALTVGYTIKSYILYTSCYNAYCPTKELGIYLMLGSSIVMLIASVFPELTVKKKIDN